MAFSPHGMSSEVSFQQGCRTVESMWVAWSVPTANYGAFVHPSEVMWVQISRFVACEAGGVRKVHHRLDLRPRVVQLPWSEGS